MGAVKPLFPTDFALDTHAKHATIAIATPIVRIAPSKIQRIVIAKLEIPSFEVSLLTIFPLSDMAKRENIDTSLDELIEEMRLFDQRSNGTQQQRPNRTSHPPPTTTSNKAAWKAANKLPQLIDTIEDVQAAVKHLKGCRRIAVDLEGNDLGRDGTISILQISTYNKKVFLFDITSLRHSAFDAGLRDLLTNEKVTKVFFDLRQDCDALYHHYEIMPTPVLDCQVALMNTPKLRESEYLTGYKKALAFSNLLSDEVSEEMQLIKEEGHDFFRTVVNAWDIRPLPEFLLQYLVVDVVYLLPLLDKQMRRTGMEMDIEALAEASSNRAWTAVRAAAREDSGRRDFA